MNYVVEIDAVGMYMSTEHETINDAMERVKQLLPILHGNGTILISKDGKIYKAFSYEEEV